MDSQELLEKDKVEIKIMLVGESQVGKTSIINRYIGNGFERNTRPTVALGFTQKYICFGNNKLRLLYLETNLIYIWTRKYQRKK